MSITLVSFRPSKASSLRLTFICAKHTWWKAIAAFMAGGICVFALVGHRQALSAPRSRGRRRCGGRVATSSPQALAAPADRSTRTDVAAAHSLGRTTAANARPINDGCPFAHRRKQETPVDSVLVVRA